MKIILATRDQVDAIWASMAPQERIFAQGDTGIYLPLYQTLLLIKDEVELGSIVAFTDEIKGSKLKKMLIDKTYFEVG